MSPFPISDDTVVVTSTYVTRDRLPIVEVSREDDEEEGELWQFHCGNGDYSEEKMQLVGLGTILKLDPGIALLAALPMGATAFRENAASPWSIEMDGDA